MQIIDNIESYLQRLKSDYQLSITFHPEKGEYLISNSRLIKYNIHKANYCVYLKSNIDCYHKCVAKQKVIIQKLKDVERFTGVCHAGVKERVYGFYMDGKVLGFISVSGFVADKGIYGDRLERVCAQFGFNKTVVEKLYQEFSKSFPQEELLDSLVFPLCRMIEYGNIALKNANTPSSDLYFSVLSFVNNNFTNELNLEYVARKFSVSESSISHAFKKMNGKSFREYLTYLRVELAKSLLECNSLSVNEIAFSVGFNDCGYFCKVFKKLTDKTPTEYRKRK